jgi:hypothetical protein
MGSLPPTRLVELLGDGLLVDWQSHELGPSGEGYPFFPSVTPGAVALALAGAGILAGGVGRAAAAVLSLVGILLSLGTATPAWKAVTWLVPPLRLVRFPEKYLVLAALGLAWLAALGVAALAERLPGRMRGAVPALALVLLLVEREGVARRLLPLEPAEALTAPPAVLVPVTSLAAPGQPPPRVFQQDLLVPVPAWHGAPVQSDRRLRRVALPAYGSLFGVGYVFEEDYDYSLPRSVTEWLRFLRRALPTGSPLPRAVVRGAGAVGTVRTSALRPGVSVPELRLEPEPLPPYRFAARVVADADDARLFARYLADSADPACAYVHRGDGSGAGVLAGPGSGPAGEGNVLSVSDGASALAVDVLVPGPVPAVLQLFRLREACLEATLDGREVEVLDANFGFAAVEVPAGRHRLVLRPPTGWLHWGVGLSGLSLLVLAGLVLAPCLRVESR